MIIEHKPLIILGNGGHAKVLLEILTDNNEKLLGTISNEKIDIQKIYQILNGLVMMMT